MSEPVKTAHVSESAPIGGDVGAEYPSTWRAEDRGHWDGASPELRGIISARERGWGTEREQYRTGHDNWSRFSPIIDRYSGLFKEEGIDPELGVSNLLQLAHTLRHGDEHVRSKVLDEMQRVYGAKQAKEFIDPEVADLKKAYDQQLAELKKSVSSVEQGFRGYMEEDTKRAIDAFAKREDRPHFSAVSQMMGKLIKGGLAPDMEGAYEMAVKLTPGLTEPQKAAIKTSQTRQALQAAGVNVRGNGAPPGSKKPAGTLRSALSSAYDKLQAKG